MKEWKTISLNGNKLFHTFWTVLYLKVFKLSMENVNLVAAGSLTFVKIIFEANKSNFVTIGSLDFCPLTIFFKLIIISEKANNTIFTQIFPKWKTSTWYRKTQSMWMFMFSQKSLIVFGIEQNRWFRIFSS